MVKQDGRGKPRFFMDIGGVNTPVEFREALTKADRGNVVTGIQVRMERKKREALNALAAESGLKVAEFLRLVIDASVKLGIDGVRIFIDTANKVGGM